MKHRDLIRPALLAVGLFACTLSDTAVAQGVFSKKNTLSLAELSALDTKVVSLALLAQPGKSTAVAAAVKAAGGYIRYRADAVDFLTVTVPRERVREMLELPTISAAGLDDRDKMWHFRGLSDQPPQSRGTRPPVYATSARPMRVAKAASEGPGSSPDSGARPAWPPPVSSYPLEHPYDVWHDIEADTYRAANPTFDGRGVVIAHVEGFPDLLVPELQVALDAQGRPVRKFLDIINHPWEKPELDAHATREDWEWVKLGAPQSARNGEVAFDGKMFKVPRATGRYRFGTIDIPVYVLAPLNLPRAGNESQPKADSVAVWNAYFDNISERFTVLWAEDDRRAFIDSNRNGDFTDERGIRDFHSTGDIGELGRDDPATLRRDSRGYALERDGDWLSFNFGADDHATMVAGAAAGNRGKDGRVDGIAPAAQFIVVNKGFTYSSYAWALITAFADERTDMVLIEPSLILLGEDHLKDGQSILGQLMGRLAQVYRKPSFWPANNETQMSTIIDAGVQPDTLAIGIYDTADSFLNYMGIRLPWQARSSYIGSEGPAGNGANKPDVLAPSMMTTPRDRALDMDVSSGVAGLYQMPPGYMRSAGTSTATPIATGAAALLVSGAKQRGLPHDAQAINRAMRSSAHYLPNEATFRQGAGVIRVASAWEVLQKAKPPVTIEVDAPVSTLTSHLLAKPNRGVGLFEREGWRAGANETRRVMLTRRSGPKGLMTFKTSWLGNGAGTFSAPAEVSLPLGEPTPLEVRIAPRKEGAFSSTLQLRAADGTDTASFPVTVVVPYELDAASQFSRDIDIDVPILGREAVFVRVPPGMDALRFEAQFDAPRVSITLQDPIGRDQGFSLQLNPVTGRSVETIPRPVAGVWSIYPRDASGAFVYFRTRNTYKDALTMDAAEPPPPIKVKLRVSLAKVQLLGASASQLRDGQVESVEVTNQGAKLARSSVIAQIASVRSEEGTLVRGEQRVFDINVPRGTQMVHARVAPLGAMPFDADIYLYDCTGKKCFLMRTGRSYEKAEQVFAENPAPGRWRVVIDASAAARGPMRYEYQDFFTNPEGGVISSLDAANAGGVGASWQVAIKPWLRSVPLPAGRALFAAVFAKDRDYTSSRDNETTQEWLNCSQLDYCGTEDRETVPLGLMLLPLAR